MKMIELLVKVLPGKGGWPVGAAFAVQDKDSNTIKFGGKDCTVAVGKLDNPEAWQGEWSFTAEYDFDHHELANDWDVSVVTRFQYESALTALTETAPQQVESWAWSGEGLPPVGTECEHCPGGTTQNDWEIVTVLGISERPGGVFTDYWLRKEDGSSYVIGNPYRFRPIRTEADRRREAAIDAIQAAFLRIPHRDCIGEGIWEHIAEGKIPGVKLCE